MPPPPQRRGGRGRGGRGRGRGAARGRADREGDLELEVRSEAPSRAPSPPPEQPPPGTNSLPAESGRASRASTVPAGDVDSAAGLRESITDLQRSYDFAKDDEERERLRQELERLRSEEEERNANLRNLRGDPGGNMDKDRQKVVATWIGRMEGVNHKNVKKAQKDLTKEVKSIVPSAGTLYGICENFDTYQHGGLFPLLHLSEDSGVVNKLLNTDSFLDSDVLGPGNMVDQGVFEEVACITPQIEGSGTTNSVIAVSAFKSIETSPNAKLIKEWKQWTGARAFLQDIVMAGLECTKIRFLVRVAPTEEPEGFYYMLTTEVPIREPSDEGLFVDTLQRFRVERWFGYNTIYRKIG